jgi:Isochorismatase family
MTTLDSRPNTALVVLDVQNGVVEGTHERDVVVASIGRLVDRARQARVPVVWIQHSDENLTKGSDEWRIVPELAPGDTEPIVEKHYADAFEDTTLETVLADLGVGRLVVSGAQTDECIRSTLHGAFPGIRRDAGQRCPHDGGSDGLGCAAASSGHRAHQSVLDVPQGAGPDRRHGRDQGRRLRRPNLSRARRPGQPGPSSPASGTHQSPRRY